MPGHSEHQHHNQAKHQIHPGDRQSLSLNTWLITLLLLTAFLPLCVLTFIASSQVNAQMRDAAYQALQHSASQSASDISATLKRHTLALSSWNKRVKLDATGLAEDAKLSQDTIAAKLNEELACHQPYINDLAVIDKSGEVFVSTTIQQETGIKVDPGKLGEHLALNEIAVWLECENCNPPLLHIFTPFTEVDDPDFSGIIASFNPELVNESMHSSLDQMRTHSFGIAWDSQQRILADTQNRFPAGADLTECWPEAKQSPPQNPWQPKPIELRVQERLQLSLYATVAIPEWDWMVMYAQPVKNVVAPGIMRSGYSWIGLLLFLLLFVILATILARMIATPVTKLTSALNEAAAGRITHLTFATNIRELNLLADAYQKLSNRLGSTVRGMEENNQDLSSRYDYLQRFVAATNRLSGFESMQQLCPAFLEEVAQQIGATGGSLYTIAGNQLNLMHALDPGHAPSIVAFPPNPQSPFGKALKKGNPLLLDHLADGSYHASGWDGYLQDDAIILRLMDKDDQPIALIALHNKTGSRFTQQDLELCSFFASFGCERFRLSKAKEELAASESRFRRLVETAQEGILTVDDQEQVTFVNNRIARALGYRPTELVGMPLTSIIRPQYHELVFSGTLQRRRGISSIYEVEMIAKDGRTCTMQVAASPLLDQQGAYEGALGVLTDITDLKRTHSDLANQSAYLHSVFTALSDMVCVIESDLKVTNANARFRREFDLPSEGSLDIEYSRLFENLLSPNNRLAPAALVRETFTSKENQTGEFLLLASDGERIVEVDAAPLFDSTGQVIGVVEVLRDVSGQRRLESQLRHAHKMEAVGRLASGIAHDFNNLLTAITGCAEIALGEIAADSTAAHELKEICQATQRGREVVRQILALSRRQEQDRRPVSLRTVVSEVLSLMRASLPPAIEIHQEFNAPRDDVLADAGQLHQVVMNLCTNAVQAMAATGGMLSANIRTENVGVDQLALHPHLRPGEHVRLDISDTGHGIEAEMFERIFEPFFTTKGGQGTGLGLSVAQSHVLSHGGAIEVSSKPGGGSCFSILLPLTDTPAMHIETLPMASQGQERVLFVDDEQLIVRTTERLLSKLGYHVNALADSRAALQLIQKDPTAFDILITDQTMPVVTGIELATAALKLRPNLPVVLCTGYSESVPPERAKQLGISEYVMKPYSGEELGVVIRRLLDSEGS